MHSKDIMLQKNLLGFPKSTTVCFKNIKAQYLSSEVIRVIVCLPCKMQTRETDWVGLLPLGWSNIHQNLTFEWVSEGKFSSYCSNNDELLFEFSPQFHSHLVEEKKFYQFVYVTRQIEVLSASTPFQFQTNSGVLKTSLNDPVKQLPAVPSSAISSSRSYLSTMDFTIAPPYYERKNALRMALKRNRSLEKKIAQLENNLNVLITERKKAEELAKYATDRLNLSQSCIRDLMTALDKNDTVKLIHGRTEMTIKKVEISEPPKIYGCCTKIIEKSKGPELGNDSRIEASIVKDICGNLSKNIKSLGTSWNVKCSQFRPNNSNGEAFTTSSITGDKTAPIISERNPKSTESSDSCEEQKGSNSVKKPNSERNFQEYLITKAHSFFPSVSFLEQKVYDMRQALDIIGQHLNLTKNKWSVLWNDAKASNNRKAQVMERANGQNEKKVSIKLVIPMTQKDILDIIGRRESGKMHQTAEKLRRDSARRDLENDGVKITGRTLEID